MTTATIKLFLVHGDPKRLRTAELSNWSGKAVAGPRSEFEGLLAREESQQAGVYLLTGNDPETGKPSIYIGEAECIKDRIKSHLVKDFWNQVVYFVSKDENLTKSHIRYLEGQLLTQAILAKRSIVKNNQSSGAKLPESDREDMEVFLGKVYQLLPVLGVELLVKVSEDEKERKDEKEVLRCEIKGIKATGYPVPNGFLILKGSEAVYKERPSVEKWPWPKHMRQKFLEEGILKDGGDRYIFTEDTEFTSPSAAAAVIHGGHANGLTAWKYKDGKTLKEMESL
jgi:hypothetical protein